MSADDARRDFAERLIRRFLSLCESTRTRAVMLRLVRSSVGDARAGRMLYRAINRTALTPAARATGVHSSAMKMELVISQLVGPAMVRYVLEIEPVASAPAEVVVAQMAPAIRATLKG